MMPSHTFPPTTTVTAATATIGQTPIWAMTFTVGTTPPDDDGLASDREPRVPLPQGPPPARIHREICGLPFTN